MMPSEATDMRQGGQRRAFLPMLMILLTAWLLPAPMAAADGQPQVLDKSELAVQSGERTFRFQVELAGKPQERRIGLMHRRDMAADHGMLFDFGRPQPVSMWMRNTYIPLDMMFIREGGEIVNIIHDTVPQSEAILSSSGPVRFVLEVPAGTTRLLGIQAGDKVLHEAIGNKPVSGNVNG